VSSIIIPANLSRRIYLQRYGGLGVSMVRLLPVRIITKVLVPSLILTLCSARGITAQTTDTGEYYHPSRHVRNVPDIAADAASKGLQSIRIQPLLIDYVEMPNNMVDLLSGYTEVIARVAGSSSRLEGVYRDSIVTDIALDGVEYIAGKELPVDAGKRPITVTIHGGAIVEQGIHITQPTGFPGLEPGQAIAVLLDCETVNGKAICSIPWGFDSVALVSPAGSISFARWMKNGTIKTFLEDESITTLAQLQAAFKAVR
jgi:hypothetical protein